MESEVGTGGTSKQGARGPKPTYNTVSLGTSHFLFLIMVLALYCSESHFPHIYNGGKEIVWGVSCSSDIWGIPFTQLRHSGDLIHTAR